MFPVSMLQLVVMPYLQDIPAYQGADIPTRVAMEECYNLAKGLDTAESDVKQCDVVEYSLMTDVFDGAIRKFIVFI